ncbi:hypothetical protein ATS72_006035 [Pseudoalteromonas sp. 13-15]|uniref:DUF6136 family protein n=1 Tax=Pseudoalteromonas TaxID=53246 RepID=UPI0007313EDD|nr:MULTISPECIES: DUF6136 family protein [Pseudoalteromonas]AUL73180.1 hypothetical protein ATS72_006035 [Pseudoalteromonas sp. 13-15]SIN84240.1 hypothetical protein SAMN05878071_1211 [Pseudoalteromonas marina]
MSFASVKGKLEQYRAFMSYRYLAYTFELKQLLLQLKSFGLIFLVVLGSSILGLVLLLFLGLGKIIDSTDAPAYGAQMALFYLLLQSVMLSAIKSAIKNSKQRLFQHTIACPSWLNIADIKLLLISNGWLIASLLIALDLTWAQWIKVPHFFVFMFIQLGLGIVCLYKPSALVYGFTLSTLFLFTAFELSPLIYHLGFAIIFLLSASIPVININGMTSVRSLFSFWFCYFINHSWTLVWRISLLLCVFMASAELLEKRPDLVNIIGDVAVAFIVLFSSSLQFDCTKVHGQHRLFFKMNQKARAFYISQFMPSMLLFLGAFIAYSITFERLNSTLLNLGFVWCLLQVYFAQKKPAHYALVWIISNVGLLALLN